MPGTCPDCGKPFATKRNRCYRCQPGGKSTGRRSNAERLLWHTIPKTPGIRVKRPAPVNPIEGHPMIQDGTRQTEEYRARKADERRLLPKGCKGSADGEKEAWADVARAKRLEIQQERKHAKDRRRPGDGITGAIGWEPRGFARSLLAGTDAE